MRWLLLCLSLPWASAQAWSVQAAAFSDAGTARALQTQLASLGYDAYLTLAGESGVTRVRVGCFTRLDGAQHFAEQLTRRLSQKAVAVPLPLESPLHHCLDREVGFIVPAAWGIYAQAEEWISFWVEVGVRRYFVSFDGRWQLAQTEAELTYASLNPNASPGLPELFTETYTEKERFVRWGEAQFIIAAGEILWQNGLDVLVLEEDALAAYQVVAYRIAAKEPD